MKTDNCNQAAEMFTTSQKLDSSAATVLNLATCHARLGRRGSAVRAYRQAADLAGAENRNDLRDAAFHAIAVLAPMVPQLTVIVHGTAPLSITINGQPFTAESAQPVPLDPGSTVIEASSPGRSTWRQIVSGDQVGAAITVEIPDLLPTSAAPEANEVADWRPAALAVGGVGLAGIVVGSILGLSAKASADDMSSNCREGQCNPSGMDARNDADRKATLANYAFGIGAVLAATGVGLWLASPQRSGRAVAIAPWMSPSNEALGLSIEGRL